MTLEQEAFKERGGFGVRTPPSGGRRSGGWDWLARLAALLLLLAFLSAALVVLWSYVPVGFVATVAALWVVLAAVASRTRDLGKRVQFLEDELERQRGLEPPASPPGS